MTAVAPLDDAAAAAALHFLIAAGCDVPVSEPPRQWLAEPKSQRPADPALPVPSAVPRPAPAAADIAAPHPALACESVAALQALLGRFPDARLRAPLLYEGALESRIWVLVDRPDHDPGHRETITRMLAAIGLDWSRAALISRLPWPTPGDGEPSASLLARFTPVLDRLAALAPPTHVLALGQYAAEMAGPQAQLTSSRGRWFDMPASWGGARLLPSLHPRTMGANKDLKRQALAHLQLFQAALS